MRKGIKVFLGGMLLPKVLLVSAVTFEEELEVVNKIIEAGAPLESFDNKPDKIEQALKEVDEILKAQGQSGGTNVLPPPPPPPPPPPGTAIVNQNHEQEQKDAAEDFYNKGGLQFDLALNPIKVSVQVRTYGEYEAYMKPFSDTVYSQFREWATQCIKGGNELVKACRDFLKEFRKKYEVWWKKHIASEEVISNAEKLLSPESLRLSVDSLMKFQKSTILEAIKIIKKKGEPQQQDVVVAFMEVLYNRGLRAKETGDLGNSVERILAGVNLWENLVSQIKLWPKELSNPVSKGVLESKFFPEALKCKYDSFRAANKDENFLKDEKAIPQVQENPFPSKKPFEVQSGDLLFQKLKEMYKTQQNFDSNIREKFISYAKYGLTLDFVDWSNPVSVNTTYQGIFPGEIYVTTFLLRYRSNKEYTSFLNKIHPSYGTYYTDPSLYRESIIRDINALQGKIKEGKISQGFQWMLLFLKKYYELPEKLSNLQDDFKQLCNGVDVKLDLKNEEEVFKFCSKLFTEFKKDLQDLDEDVATIVKVLDGGLRKTVESRDRKEFIKTLSVILNKKKTSGYNFVSDDEQIIEKWVNFYSEYESYLEYPKLNVDLISVKDVEKSFGELPKVAPKKEITDICQKVKTIFSKLGEVKDLVIPFDTLPWFERKSFKDIVAQTVQANLVPKPKSKVTLSKPLNFGGELPVGNTIVSGNLAQPTEPAQSTETAQPTESEQTEVARLKQENQKLQEALEAAEKAKNELEIEKDKKIKELKEEIKQLQNELKEKGKQLADMEKEKNGLAQEKDELKAERDKAKAELEKVRNELQAQINSLGRERDALFRGNSILANENSTLTQQRNDLANENKVLKNRPEPKPVVRGGGTSTIIREDKEAKKTMQERIDAQSEALGAKDKELDAKNEQIQSLTNELAKARQRINELESNKKPSKDSNFWSEEDLEYRANAAAQLEQLRQEVAEQAKTIMADRKKLDDERKKLEDAKKQFQEVKNASSMAKGGTEKPENIKIGIENKEMGTEGSANTPQTSPIPESKGSTSDIPTKVNTPSVQPSSLQQPVRVPATSQARTGLMQRPSDKRVAEPASNRVGNKSQIPQSRSSRLRLLQSAR